MKFTLIQKILFALQAPLYCGSADAEGGNISLNLKYWNFGCAKETDTALCCSWQKDRQDTKKLEDGERHLRILLLFW